MSSPTFELKPGSWVEVKSPAEIAATLDENGTRQGLPFMPEMIELCGRRFQVLRRAEKSCVECEGGFYQIREFADSDVYLLDGLRCSGQSHGGCQRACLFFWKTAWLRKVDSDMVHPPTEPQNTEALLRKLKTMASPERYFCQSTQLLQATQRFPTSRLISKCLYDLRSGAVSLRQMVKLVGMPLIRKVSDRLFGRRRANGTLTRTPAGNLDLQPGEWVEVLPYQEILKTLDQKGRNRGLVYDIEVRKFSGKRYRVRNRLDRMIAEPSGVMKNVQATVILEGNTCMCARSTGGCPRLEFAYWREIWLKRVEVEQASEANHTGCVEAGVTR